MANTLLAIVLCAVSAVTTSATYHANGMPNAGANAVRISPTKHTIIIATKNTFADRADQVLRVPSGAPRRDHRGRLHPAAAPHPLRSPERHGGRETGGVLRSGDAVHLGGADHQRPGEEHALDPRRFGIRCLDREPEGFHLFQETCNAGPGSKQEAVLEFQVVE